MHYRQKRILEMLDDGKLSIAHAARELGVTEMTVRRDLRILEEEGLVLAVRGGVIRHPVRYEPESEDAETRIVKTAIAEAFWERIRPVDSLFLSTGSTVLAFARLLARRNTRPLTVITSSLSVASALFRSSCRVVLLGGELRTQSLDLVGPAAEKNLAEYHVDWLVSGSDGISPEYGFYTSDINLSNLERKSISIADHVAILADSSKFSRKSLVRFAAPDEVDILVTDQNLSSEDREKLALHSSLELILA